MLIWPADEVINNKLDGFSDALLDARTASENSDVWHFENVGPEDQFADIHCSGDEGYSFIYMFWLSKGDPSECLADFLSAKASKEFALPKVNYSNEDDLMSSILYVGSSRRGIRGIRSRLKQHCRKTPKATYALKLETWLRPEDFEVSVLVRSFKNLSPLSLEFLETAISLSANPLFGKIGSNGR